MAGKVKDLTGCQYGRWTVVGIDHVEPGQGAYFICRCQCGTTRPVVAKSLREGKSKSCGCTQKLPKGVAACNSLFRSYKQGAEKRGLSFDLTIEQFRSITKKNCYYCGDKPRQDYRNVARYYNGGYTYNGIDRRNNKKGYTLANSIPSCGVCNYMKRTMSIAEFVNHCRKIVLNR